MDNLNCRYVLARAIFAFLFSAALPVEAYDPNNRTQFLAKIEEAKASPAAITGQLIAAWRDRRLQEVSKSTVLRELQLLGQARRQAMMQLWADYLDKLKAGAGLFLCTEAQPSHLAS